MPWPSDLVGRRSLGRGTWVLVEDEVSVGLGARDATSGSRRSYLWSRKKQPGTEGGKEVMRKEPGNLEGRAARALGTCESSSCGERS